MLSLLLLIFLCGINTSRSGYPERNLDPSTANSDDIKMRQFTRNTFPRHRLNSMAKNQHNSRYRGNRAYHNSIRDYRLNQRFLYPHRYWYTHNLRNSDPSFHQQLSVERRENNPKFLKHRHSLRFPKRAFDRSAYGAYQSRIDENGLDSPFQSHKQRNDRNSNDRLSRISYKSSNELQATAQKRGTDKKFRKNPYASRSLENLNPVSSDGSNGAYKNGSSSLELGSQMNEKKREVAKAKMAGLSPAKRLYRSLGRFDLLYLLGLFLIFIPVASIAVVILPIASFCWSICKRQPPKEVTRLSSNEIIVETAVMNELPGSKKIASESESIKDIYKNFVSNDIDGEGDTVAKRMKLERWMAQSVEQRPRTRPRVNRNFNSAEMEKVEEEESDAAESTQDTTQYGESQSESEAPTENQEDLLKEPANSRRPERGKTLTKGKRRASKQESQPFAFAQDRIVNVGRIYNPRYVNPRHVYSLVDQSRLLPKRTSYSMVDINPGRFTRL